MIRLNTDQFVAKLEANPNLKIKIFNIGENIGMDLAYFCHYLSLRRMFPNITLDLCRTNVDETNCIGFEKHAGRVETPLSSIRMEVVRQRYPDGKDWTQKINTGELGIVSDDFRNISGYDLIWGIGYGGTESWLKQYGEIDVVDSNTVRHAVEVLNEKNNVLPHNDEVIDLGEASEKFKTWERTALEYLVYKDPAYPFTFTEDFSKSSLATDYKDYLRISLRWPDNVRWYYGIEKQYQVVMEIIRQIRAAGKPVKIIYNLKDGEIGNNFCRGQSLQKLKMVMDACDDIVFTYSWTVNPYAHRDSEAKELAKLRSIGAKNVIRLDLWEDLLQSKNCKVYLSDPGGFAEIISILRPNPNSTFLIPVSFHHLGTYITANKDRKPIRTKISDLSISQGYSVEPVLSAPDDPEGYRTMYWKMGYAGIVGQIGENCHGDDWKYFEAAQDGLFKQWFDVSSPKLIGAVVKAYLE